MVAKRISLVAVLTVVMLMASVSFGAWTTFIDSGDGAWTTAGNWTGGLPTSGDDAIIAGEAVDGASLNSGDTGYANWLHLCDTSTTGSKVTVNNGGTLAVSDHLLIGEEWGLDQKGTLEVNAGGTVNTTLLMCGGARFGNGGAGTLIMNGGDVNISWLMAVGGGYDAVDNGGMGGDVQLNGGTITFATGTNAVGGGGLIMSSLGSLDIAGGALSLNGVITDITSLANGGSITAYGGAGSFVYDYSVQDRTTVTAIIPEPATVLIIGLGSLLIRRKRA